MNKTRQYQLFTTDGDSNNIKGVFNVSKNAFLIHKQVI